MSYWSWYFLKSAAGKLRFFWQMLVYDELRESLVINIKWRVRDDE
ncbi:hypothetical protein MKY24_13195 [Paenibacillus sp. FSL P2-0322]